MSIDEMGAIQGITRKVQLSQLRQGRTAGVEKDWTTDNLQILGDTGENQVSGPDRDQKLKDDYNHSRNQKARFDLNKALGDIVTGSADGVKKPGAVEKKRQAEQSLKLDTNKKLDGIFGDVVNADPADRPGSKMSKKQFLSSDKAVATGENSTVLAFPRSREAGDPSVTPTSPDEIKSGMKMKTDGDKESPGKATIGSFNIEWLGQKERNPEDYKQIAGIIKDSGAAVLGIQEVASVEGLRNVMKHLPDHGYILGKSEGQMVGVIFDKNRAKYDANSIKQLDDVKMGNPYLRPPLSVDMKVDNYDFNFTVMHLKAGFKDSAIQTRDKQAGVVNRWIKDRQANNADKDMIIVGDYNDFTDSSTLQNIDKGNTVDYVTQEAGKDFYTNIRYRSVIDHAALSTGKGGASEEYIPGSLRTIDEKKIPGYTKRVSDHKPIFFDVKTDQDND